MSLNNSVLVGRLTKDPEIRVTQTGTSISRFTLAVNRSRKVEGQPEADFISCVAFNKTAENLCNHMRKGSQIGIVGRIQTGSYEKDGARVYTTDVIADNIQFLEPRSEGGQSPQNNGGYQQQNAPQTQYQAPSQQQQQSQYNQTRVNEDPFANNKGPLIVDEDSLPF